MTKNQGSPKVCDFGQYADLWKHHKDNCKQIVRITKSYIVFIDQCNAIDWETTEDFDEKRAEGKTDGEKTLSQCLIVEHKPTGGLSEDSIISFKKIIGEAIVNCLEGNFEDTAQILRQAEEFRFDRVVEKSRQWYLSHTVLLTITLMAIAILFNELASQPQTSFLTMVNVGAWAVAGACLSIILRSGNLLHASYAGEELHFIESGCRLIGGFISGLIVYLGIKSGILFASLVNDGNMNYVIYFLALLAGASERFAPSIITKIDEIESTEIKPQGN